jgi:hypothetical protein
LTAAQDQILRRFFCARENPKWAILFVSSIAWQIAGKKAHRFAAFSSACCTASGTRKICVWVRRCEFDSEPELLPRHYRAALR